MKKGADAVQYYEYFSLPEGMTADFAVAVTDNSLLPLLRVGDTVYLRRSVELRDGDVGLFYLGGQMVFRQFCADSFGSIYLFSVNRERREEDAALPPAEAEKLICYGRAELPRQISLPMD